MEEIKVVWVFKSIFAVHLIPRATDTYPCFTWNNQSQLSFIHYTDLLVIKPQSEVKSQKNSGGCKNVLYKKMTGEWIQTINSLMHCAGPPLKICKLILKTLVCIRWSGVSSLPLLFPKWKYIYILRLVIGKTWLSTVMSHAGSLWIRTSEEKHFPLGVLSCLSCDTRAAVKRCLRASMC